MILVFLVLSKVINFNIAGTSGTILAVSKELEDLLRQILFIHDLMCAAILKLYATSCSSVRPNAPIIVH